MRGGDNGRLGDILMRDENGFDLDTAQPVAADLDDVVIAAEHPEIAIVIADGGIAGEINTGEARPISFLETLGIAVNGTGHRRPRLLNDEKSFTRLHRVTFFVEDVGSNAGKRLGRRAGLGRSRAGNGRDHDAAGLGLPPSVDDGAALFADHAVIPKPRRRVDRLADRTEQTDRRQVAAVRPLVTLLDKSAYRCGGRI